MPAVLAAMEAPAILTALLLARRGGEKTLGGPKELAHEVLLNGSVVLLLGAFLIGWIGGAGAERRGGCWLARSRWGVCGSRAMRVAGAAGAAGGGVVFVAAGAVPWGGRG